MFSFTISRTQKGPTAHQLIITVLVHFSFCELYGADMSPLIIDFCPSIKTLIGE